MEFDSTSLGLILATTVVVGSCLHAWFVKPAVKRAKLNQVASLEVKIKMGGGLEIIDSFIDLACAYSALGRHNDAESTMRKALSLAENEYGKKNPDIIPILKSYSKILSNMNRKIEAQTMLKRASKIASYKRSGK
ncbi:MAG: tetratricopeptide repeat protein [Candidatus Obscuribacterales bacterium]|nr:tetratricopeptide repeat protein [Candidatus Obscuribacterales bacterium]